jgi:hypothetical protein
MGLKDLLTEDEKTIHRLIKEYYTYRGGGGYGEHLRYTFEDYLDELKKCEDCGEINFRNMKCKCKEELE